MKLKNIYVWNFFLFYVLKNEIVCQKDYFMITMASHLGFEWQMSNVIVLTVMFTYYRTLIEGLTLMSKIDQTCAHSQNRCKTVSISRL